MLTKQHLSYLLLYAIFTKEDLVKFVKNKTIEKELTNLDEILYSWQNAHNFLCNLEKNESGIADNNNTFDFNSDLIELIEQNPLMKKSSPKHTREFKMVEIDNLITVQRRIFLDHIDELAKIIPKKPSEEQLLKVCLAPQKLAPLPELSNIGNNSFSFESLSSDFRFLGGYLKKQITPDDIQLTDVHGFPTHAITLFVGYPAGLVQVSKVNGRLILRNGFHRVYLLRKRGITKIPAIVTSYENHKSGFPNKLHTLTKDYLLEHPRPILMKDFFNDKLIRVFQRKKTKRTVKVKWDYQKSNIDF